MVTADDADVRRWVAGGRRALKGAEKRGKRTPRMDADRRERWGGVNRRTACRVHKTANGGVSSREWTRIGAKGGADENSMKHQPPAVPVVPAGTAVPAGSRTSTRTRTRAKPRQPATSVAFDKGDKAHDKVDESPEGAFIRPRRDVLRIMRSPNTRGDRGSQSASEAIGVPEHSLALSLSTKRRDKVWRRSVADKAWRQSVETRYGDGVRAAQRFYPLNCEPLSGRNNRHSKKAPPAP